MSTEHKKEKRKIRKQKIRQERQDREQKELENRNIDMLFILKNELYDSKPNMAKFLESYVKSIRIYVSNNIDLYPQFHYNTSKVFVKFIDGSEAMIMDADKDPKILYTKDMEDVVLKEKEKELISQFFQFLYQFKFIH